MTHLHGEGTVIGCGIPESKGIGRAKGHHRCRNHGFLFGSTLDGKGVVAGFLRRSRGEIQLDGQLRHGEDGREAQGFHDGLQFFFVVLIGFVAVNLHVQGDGTAVADGAALIAGAVQLAVLMEGISGVEETLHIVTVFLPGGRRVGIA